MSEDLRPSREHRGGAAASQGTTKSGEPKIAVLPFINSGLDTGQDYLGEGLAAEILICLTRIPGLHLVARSTVFSLRRDPLNVGEIEEHLQATAVLKGNFRLSDDRVFIAAELIDIPSGHRLWYSEFDRVLQDVFVILDEIAAGITCALDLVDAHLGVRNIQSIHTSDVAAYDCYVRGRHQFYQYSRHGVESAQKLFTEAIGIDNEYALAYCGIADCYSYLYMYVESSEANMKAADHASKRALVLDPLLAEAHASRGVALTLRSEFDVAEGAFEVALEIDPTLFEAHYFYARACFVQGKLDKAILHFDEAHRTRPEDYQAPLLAGQIYDSLKRPDLAEAVRREGVAVAERHLMFHPHDTRALYMAANGLVVLGEYDKGHEWLALALSLEPNDAMLLYNAGCIYALLEKPTEAMICLERTVAAGLTQKEWYVHDSNLDSLRETPRFEALLDLMA